MYRDDIRRVNKVVLYDGAAGPYRGLLPQLVGVSSKNTIEL